MEQVNGTAVFPDPDRAPSKELMGHFRRLARSSPWLWDSVQITIGVTNAQAHPLAFAAPNLPEHLTVLIRRPDAIRVEDDNGEVLFRTDDINASRDAGFVASTRKSWLLPPRLVAPVYGDDGLVSRRPEAAYVNDLMPVGLWTAFLDPVEIAGFAPGPADMAFPHPSTIHTLREIRDDRGRPCLEAVLSRGHSYAPVLEDAPLLCAGLTRIRLDRATGICVRRKVLDGPDAGLEHRVEITAVDEYLIDGLFTQPTPSLSDVRHPPLWPIPAPVERPGA
ncbi:MAG: hypothetical protein Q4P23_01740 [Micrococcaceae bacterium]|nr:hypothetical protein [Micrococcaceae bacterium]